MDTTKTLWIVIGVLFVMTLFLSFKAGAIGGGEVIKSAGTVAKTASSGMVGGC